MNESQPLTGVEILLVGAFDFSYPREKVLRDAFRHVGASVQSCTYADEPMFLGVRKIILLPAIHLRLFVQILRLARTGHTPDVIVVTRFNPLLLPLAFVIARYIGATLVYDLFVSLHRTAAMRGYPRPVVWTVSLVERLTYRLPDHLLVGTNQFIELYAHMYGIPPDRFVRVPPAADEDRFYPRDAPRRAVFTALYWGNFLPHHGVDVILDAAAILDEEASINFVFLGAGPYQAMAEASAAEQKLSNVRFEGFVNDTDLHEWIARSHVCLGVFSDDVRALASITNKVCEAAASGKAIITEDSPPIHQRFTDQESIITVPPGSPDALAVALESLQKMPERIAQLEMKSLAVNQREFSTTVIAELLVTNIRFNN